MNEHGLKVGDLVHVKMPTGGVLRHDTFRVSRADPGERMVWVTLEGEPDPTRSWTYGAASGDRPLGFVPDSLEKVA